MFYRFFIDTHIDVRAIRLGCATKRATAGGPSQNHRGRGLYGAPDTLLIRGENLDFGGGPLEVTFGNFGPLTIVSDSPTDIEVECPNELCEDGDYLVTVARGAGQSKSDEYDLTIGAVGAPGADGQDGLPGAPGADGNDGAPGAIDLSKIILREDGDDGAVDGIAECPDATYKVVGGGAICEN